MAVKDCWLCDRLSELLGEVARAARRIQRPKRACGASVTSQASGRRRCFPPPNFWLVVMAAHGGDRGELWEKTRVHVAGTRLEYATCSQPWWCAHARAHTQRHAAPLQTARSRSKPFSAMDRSNCPHSQTSPYILITNTDRARARGYMQPHPQAAGQQPHRRRAQRREQGVLPEDEG